MLRAHKIRLYPTKEQEVQMLKTAGSVRYVYNWALTEWEKAYKAGGKPNALLLDALWTQLRPIWASDTNRASQTKAIFNLQDAFKRFFRGESKYPRYHKKGQKTSFYVNNVQGYIKQERIYLPKIGHIKMAEPLRLSGKIMCYIVSFFAKKWFVSVIVELPDAERPCLNPASVVGIDVGLKHIATASDGTVLDTPESLKRLDVKLRNAQRALDRSRRNSNNHKKLLAKRQKVQYRINNIRNDVTHKFTSTITKNHGVVVVEDLDLKGMMKRAQNRSLRRVLSASLMGTIIYQLSYKARVLKKVDRFYPSTKLCSNCGHKRDSIQLNERTYVCPHCGLEIDRDLNAAINLCKAGAVSPGVPVEGTASLTSRSARSRKIVRHRQVP